MESLSIYPIVPKTHEILTFNDHTEINNYGGMNTFCSTLMFEYHLTVISHQPGSHLQLGFCDEEFEVRLPLSYNVKNYCGSLYFGTGDDTKGHSAALDPVNNVVWQNGMKSEVTKHKLTNGDKFICKYMKNKITIEVGENTYEIDTKTFNKPRPCFSLMGNIVVKLCKKRLQVLDDFQFNYGKLKV